MAERNQLFLTTVGTSEYQETVYGLADNREVRTCYAPVAAARLFRVDWTGCNALVVGTEAALAKHLAALGAELGHLGFNVESVLIAEGRDGRELLGIVQALTSSVPTGTSLVVDITHTLRHLSFAYLAALVYLAGLRRVEIVRITYGAFELKQDGIAPVVDVTPVYELLRWYHAAATVTDTGDLRALTPLAGALKQALWDRKQEPDLEVVKNLRDSGRINRPKIAFRFR